MSSPSFNSSRHAVRRLHPAVPQSNMITNTLAWPLHRAAGEAAGTQWAAQCPSRRRLPATRRGRQLCASLCPCTLPRVRCTLPRVSQTQPSTLMLLGHALEPVGNFTTSTCSSCIFCKSVPSKAASFCTAQQSLSVEIGPTATVTGAGGGSRRRAWRATRASAAAGGAPDPDQP